MKKSIEVNEASAAKVLELVDAGLVQGLGQPRPGEMCVEAAVCFALGLPHDDDPQCVARALREVMVRLNDADWPSDAARAKGLRKLAVAQLGSLGVLDEREFAGRLVKVTIGKVLPQALRGAAAKCGDVAQRSALEAAAVRCEVEQNREAAEASKTTARSASGGAVAVDAAVAASTYAAAASDYAADAAACAAATVSASGMAAAASHNTAAAAAAAAKVFAGGKRAKILALFAGDVLEILKEMGAPGCQWLPLCEVER